MAASFPVISAAYLQSAFEEGSSSYMSSPTSAAAMTRRISADGLVTVSLLKSIIL